MDKFIPEERRAHAKALHRKLDQLVKENNINREEGTKEVFLTKSERAGLVAFMLSGVHTPHEKEAKK